MLLTLNIGNTNTSLGFFEKDKLIKTISFATQKEIIKKEIEKIKLPVKAIIFCSVVLEIIPLFENILKKHFHINPIQVLSSKITYLPIFYENLNKLGVDRIVNCVAGIHQYGKPLIIIDAGTAITFDVINKKGEFIGGVISAGMEIWNKGLNQKTSQLPYVEIIKINNIIGQNTIHCIQSGITFGYIGMIKEIIKQIKKELNYAPKIITTGGNSNFIKEQIKSIKLYDSFLTLKGLKKLYDTGYK
ncbi:MAG: type III pantothenate kinase [bacterium]